MPKKAVASATMTRKGVKGHPGIYTFVNVPRDAVRERRVVEAIMAKADRPQERVLNSKH